MNNTKETMTSVVRDERGRFAKKADSTPRPFKVGDRIRSLGGNYYSHIGDIGTIVSVRSVSGSNLYYVRFDDDMGLNYWPHEIEPVPVFTIQPEAEAAFVALAKALGYQVKKV